MPSATRPFTIVDFNNFWSPSGGGVRRYHLQKMAFYEKRAQESQDVLSVFVMPDNSTYTEKRSDTLIIEHVEAFRFPGNWEYRFIWKASQVIPVLEKYRPDIIEVDGTVFAVQCQVFLICHMVLSLSKKQPLFTEGFFTACRLKNTAGGREHAPAVRCLSELDHHC